MTFIKTLVAKGAILLALLLVVVLPATRATAEPYVHGIGMHLGRGVDAKYGTAVGEGVVGSPQFVTAPGGRPGVEVSRDLLIEEDSSKFEDSIAQSFGVKAGAFGFGLEVGSEYRRSCGVTSNSIYAIVRVKARMNDVVLRSPHLTQDAIDTLGKGAKAFRDKYGTHYIGSMSFGGMYLGVLVARTDSVTARTEIANRFRASAFGFGLDASFSSAVAYAQQHSTLQVTEISIGGEGGITATKVEELIQNANTFSRSVARAPAPIEVSFFDYSKIDNFRKPVALSGDATAPFGAGDLGSRASAAVLVVATPTDWSDYRSALASCPSNATDPDAVFDCAICERKRLNTMLVDLGDIASDSINFDDDGKDPKDPASKPTRTARAYRWVATKDDPKTEVLDAVLDDEKNPTRAARTAALRGLEGALKTRHDSLEKAIEKFRLSAKAASDAKDLNDAINKARADDVATKLPAVSKALSPLKFNDTTGKEVSYFIYPGRTDPKSCE